MKQVYFVIASLLSGGTENVATSWLKDLPDSHYSIIVLTHKINDNLKKRILGRMKIPPSFFKLNTESHYLALIFLLPFFYENNSSTLLFFNLQTCAFYLVLRKMLPGDCLRLF